jgi:hypothetical protein
MVGECFVSGSCVAKPGENGTMPVTWVGQQPIKQSVYAQLSSDPGCCLGVQVDFGTGGN